MLLALDLSYISFIGSYSHIPNFLRVIIFFSMNGVLVCSGYCNNNFIDCVVYKQQTFISYSSGGWEVQDPGVSRFAVWWGPISWFTGGWFLEVSSYDRKVSKLSGVPFLRTLIPFMIVLASWPNNCLVAPHLNTLKAGISTWYCGGCKYTNALEI